MNRCSLSANALLWSALLAPAACAPNPANHDDEVETTEAALTVEEFGGGAEVIARRYFRDPDVTLASYALPGMDGCSAAMIGPNIAMSAAHCGAFAHSITFRTYRNASPALSDTETFSCRHLVQTFADSDLLLLHCDANAAGENPGDKYGYLDFDTTAPVVNQSLYSVWTNPVDSLGLGDARIYSEGRVLSVTDGGWFTPGDARTAVSSTVWGQPGASGSPSLNPLNHRIQVGPTSVAGVGHWKSALSIRDYLRFGVVDRSQPYNRNEAELRAQGLVPDAYFGPVDRDHNDLFDVQEHIELRRGEARRDHYYLGFESPRRNALWRVEAAGSIDPGSRTARIVTDRAALGLRHLRLNLAPATTYRVSLMTYTGRADSAAALEVRLVEFGPLDKEASSPAITVDRHPLATVPGTGWQLQTFTLTTRAGNSELQIAARAGLDVTLLAPSFIAESSVMNFDSADKRVNWRNENDGRRAFIVPDGQGNGPNFAAFVWRDGSRARGNDWPLRNRQLALLPRTWHRMCASVRHTWGVARGDSWGVMRVLSGTGEAVRANFAPSKNWSTACSAWFIPSSSDNNVQFGVDTGPDGVNLGYLVDDIRIETWRPALIEAPALIEPIAATAIAPAASPLVAAAIQE